MKLILKRIERVRAIGIGSIRDEEVFNDDHKFPGPFALHTEDGQILPCQVSNAMESECGVTRLTVTFLVDGNKVRVEGDA